MQYGNATLKAAKEKQHGTRMQYGNTTIKAAKEKQHGTAS
jgi:hypothetical protein